MAIRCGLTLGANLGCTNLAVESDSHNALEAISDPNTYMGIGVPIIAECSLLTLEFASITFDHFSGEANSSPLCKRFGYHLMNKVYDANKSILT